MVLNGIDIASWQAGINVGTSGVAADFVIVKATGGTGYVNPDCNRAVQQALASGKKVGVYHYAHEQGFQGSAQQEADFFLKNVQGYIGKAILILDWESDNKGDVAWAKMWLDTVTARTGVKPLFYTYTGVLNSYNFSSIANANYGLWVANYGSDAAQGHSKPNPPSSPYWKSTAMYQYTSNGWLNGWNGRLDLNVFYGDQATWDKLAGKAGSSSTSNTITIKNKGVATMYALYEYSGKWYFYNGVTYEYVGHPDALVIIKEVYRKNNGKEIPEFHWKKGAPWWSRLEQPVVDLQKLSDTVAKIAKKVGV